MAELYAAGIAAMLAANAAMHIGAHLLAHLNRHLHQLADALLIKLCKGIVLIDLI